MMHGSVVLPTRLASCSMVLAMKKLRAIILRQVVFVFANMCAGGPSAAHTAILVLSARDGVRDPVSVVLWADGELDCLLDHCALCGVQN